MTSPNEFDPPAYTMNRLGPHVMVEKVSPLKRAVCHKNGRRAKQKVRFWSEKSARKSNLKQLDSLRLNFGNGTRGQWSARMEWSARG